MEPLFCSDGSDNPAVLRYFGRLRLRILTLPPSATQSQVINTICADMPRSTIPIEYEAYQLAANRAHWHISKIDHTHGLVYIGEICPQYRT